MCLGKLCACVCVCDTSLPNQCMLHSSANATVCTFIIEHFGTHTHTHHHAQGVLLFWEHFCPVSAQIFAFFIINVWECTIKTLVLIKCISLTQREHWQKEQWTPYLWCDTQSCFQVNTPWSLNTYQIHLHIYVCWQYQQTTHSLASLKHKIGEIWSVHQTWSVQVL